MIGFKFIKFSPNEYVLRYKKGKLIQEGKGLSFFYSDRSTALSAVPTSSVSADFSFSETTRDYQKISVQGQFTYRIIDYKTAADVFDFSVTSKNTKQQENTILKISNRLINLSKVLIKQHIEELEMKEAIMSSGALAAKTGGDFANNEEIKKLGVEIIGFSILAISPNPDTARALEAQTREMILKQADDAVYERRNSSIDQERKVKENELSTEISIGEQQRQIKDKELETKRMVMEKESEIMEAEMNHNISLENIKSQHTLELEETKIKHKISMVEKEKQIVESEVDNSKKRSEAKAYQLSAVVKVLGEMNTDVLVAMAQSDLTLDKLTAKAFTQLAEKVDKIGQINITPDLLDTILNKDAE